MGPGILKYVIMFSPLAFVMVMSFGINRISTPTLQLLFWAFATVMGLSMSSIFLVYTGTSIAQTFFATRSEEHTSELQSLMRISYAVFCLKKKTKTNIQNAITKN